MNEPSSWAARRSGRIRTMDTTHDDADRAKQRFRLALLNLLRQPEAWDVLDDAMTVPYTFDLEHRGSTMQVTIGPYPGSERRT